MKLVNARLNRGGRVLADTPLATSFRTIQRSPTDGVRARRGLLKVNGTPMETPALFPVLNLLTGPPSLERNGATHKFLKQQLLFEDRRPAVMSEVLHFTDYHFRPRMFRQWFPHTDGTSEAKTLEYWVRHSLREQGKPDDYHPLFFLDSGGFRLLFNRDVDIAEFGYHPTQESMLQLQLDYGADIICSLDYPVPPMLSYDQVVARIANSIDNAVLLMDLLYRQGKVDPTGKRPFPILAIHGQTPEQISSCVLQLFRRLADAGFTNEPFGIGIGSLVPLRVSSNYDRIVMLVQAVVETLYGPDVPSAFDPQHIPIHAFGITGDMIPVLTHLGVDTYDSSSYIKSASVLDYYDPTTWSPLDFRKLGNLPCACRVCAGITPRQLSQLQEVLRGGRIDGHKERINLEAGHFTVNIKSDVYGIIAYHNLTLQDREITRMRDAIVAGETAKQLVSFSQAHARAQKLVEFVAQIDPSVAVALGHVHVELFPRTQEEITQHYNAVSLTNDPSAFDLSQDATYTVPASKDRLLIIACTQAKPYRKSKSHATIWRFLRDHVGDEIDRCHKVTLSGLYGPVPLEFEDVEAVRTYEYILSSSAKRQQALVTARLVAYLEAHMSAYRQVVAYVTAGAYRYVIETAFAEVRRKHADIHGINSPLPTPLLLAPRKSRGTGTKDLLSYASLGELVRTLYPDVDALGSHPSQDDMSSSLATPLSFFD